MSEVLQYTTALKSANAQAATGEVDALRPSPGISAAPGLRAESPDLIQDTDLKRETVKEPAKRWRNRYRTKEHDGVVEIEYANGSVESYEGYFWGDSVFPSKEIAEQNALEWLGDFDGDRLDDVIDYLGAFPIDGSGE